MNRDRGRLRLGSQGGYTVVEMIITMSLTTIVSGALFSSFLVLDRIQTAWEQRDQARAIGVLAEQSLLRDVQAYDVVKPVAKNTLKLQGVSTGQTAPFTVTYFLQPSGGGTSVLKRVAGPALPTTVAHGVQSIEATCNGNTLTVVMTLDAISLRSKAEQVVVNPVLTLTPRNGTCPS